MIFKLARISSKPDGDQLLSDSSRIYKGIFIERPNRFLGRVDLNDHVVDVFIPNPGRMHELLIPRREVYIREAFHEGRKTNYNMIGMVHDDVVVSIDSTLPNRFMKKLLESQRFDPFAQYTKVLAEPRVYEGRFDFKLENDLSGAYLEVKSCTLVEDGRALFPDAPTSRGARHLRGLMQALRDELVDRAAVTFVIQRPDAVAFSPNDSTDPEFSRTLREAESNDVEIYALSCRVMNWDLELIGEIPIELESS